MPLVELFEILAGKIGALKAKRDLVLAQQNAVAFHPGTFLVLRAAAFAAVFEVLFLF